MARVRPHDQQEDSQSRIGKALRARFEADDMERDPGIEPVVRATPRRKLSRPLRNAVDADDDETALEIARAIAGIEEFDAG